MSAILIAEDDDEARTMLQRFLESKGHVVRAVADGEAVVQELAQEVFDLVILDAMMPRLSGFEALRRARDVGDPTPVIMTTALGAPEDAIRAFEIGADDFMTKPFHLAVLMARVQHQLSSLGGAHDAEVIELSDANLVDANAIDPVPDANTIDADLVDADLVDADLVDADLADADLVDEVDAGVVEAAGDEHAFDDVSVVIEAPTLPASETLAAIIEATAGSREDDLGFLARLRGAAGTLRRRRSLSAPSLVVGSVLGGRYRIEEKIGAGGFGTVFRARHLDMDRAVAIKVLRAGAGNDAVGVFRQEAQNASRVQHENAVRVYDFGVLDDGCAYLIMELLVGPTLEATLGRRPVSVTRAAEIMRPVLSALASAHRQGVVHRDVKPGNIVLHRDDEREVPKLLDFGIAMHVNGRGADKPGFVAGSPAYLAPERFRGAPADGRSDVYACGIVLYRLLTGMFPFDAAVDDVEAQARAHLLTPPPPPSTRNAGLSPEADELVLAMLHKEVKSRPNAADAASLVESLGWA